jgi:hypothetical protein
MQIKFMKDILIFTLIVKKGKVTKRKKSTTINL